MSIKSGSFFVVLFFVFFSCTKTDKFPAKLSEKINSDTVSLNQTLFHETPSFLTDSVRKIDFEKELNELLIYKQFYINRNEQFDLLQLENLWKKLKVETTNFDVESISGWVEITGFLLEITGKEMYAQELENVIFQSSGVFSVEDLRKIEKQMIPWIFTKDVDHIHVNLFANATIKYNHSLKGAIEISQETNFPESGKILIKFKTGEKRYVELFVSIPDWAEGATVTEKGVKYVATPGSYSQVARKWSTGDFVEVNLPVDKMPGKLKFTNIVVQ